jgi:malonyl CoA-acyl carrier protein transacylase
MGLDFAEKSPQAAAIYSAARSILSFDPAIVCRGEDERLGLTEFTQPTILTMELAAYEALRARYQLRPRRFGGHSLGEYTALVAAGAIPFEVALPLVALRGRLMQAATPPGIGLMAALIMEGLPLAEIREACARAGVDIANENSPTQVVLSGLTAAVEEVLAAFEPLEAEGGMRIVRLATSAPFHSRHMREIEGEFRAALEAVRHELTPARATQVTSNQRGGFHTGELADLIDALVYQLAGTVRWQDNMRALLEVVEPDSILEIGPERTLRAFFAAVEVSIPAVQDMRTAERALRATAKKAA